MDNMDNTGAPVIPSGTKPTVYGQASFATQQPIGSMASAPGNLGQAQPAPDSPIQAVQQNAPVGITFAELAAKKGFNSPDDLAKAYENLESHNKKVEMTAADIIKEVYAANPTAAPVAPPPVFQPSQADNDAIKIVQNIVKSAVKPLEEELALNKLFSAKPDASQYAEGMAKAVKENPNITWENAYKIAKFDALQQQATVTKQQESAATAQLKQQVIAGNASPTQSRGTPDIRGIIKDRSVPFKEVDKMVREFLQNQN